MKQYYTFAIKILLKKRINALFLFLAVCIGFMSCKEHVKSEYVWKSIQVRATAYNSVPNQTDTTPTIGAWGDSLYPAQKSIAVSRDLIPMGITRNTKVIIEGLPGVYVVKDKMARRWRKRIDIYMDTDIKKAKKWGIKTLYISYALKKNDSLQSNLETTLN